ncbi:hypothetical protein CEUSTIGMA_g1152.t1 [Chlamydomonas eustigma]|uniref:Uncharacterized protein n=1 Tax=Chlamydomonas eustigma TaxID=1157962 RepID=A0A250WT53_9CHLO|nr:hypothetical protein CEUSTIGMA_g1152.t1 [Chlamydomonas eustigma]|eukprot:GAX73700.1 hypothetical protein CEUSTIGMA_g1152.t1 [Chlamydomonas eustigma]
MAPENDQPFNTTKDVLESSGAIHAPTRVRAKRNRKQTTVGFHALPAYLKDNEFIRGYYRRVLPVNESFKSLFGLHNETGNIYTHLLGFFMFLALTIYIARLPPTPLAFGHQQVDALWHSVCGNLDRIQEGLQEGVHNLQHGVQHLQEGLQEGVHNLQHGVQHLQEGLQEGVHNLQHGVQHLQEGISERVHSLQEGISERVHTLHEGFSETVHHLHEGLSGRVHTFQDSVLHMSVPGAAAAYEALANQLRWPTVRWPTFVFMAGAMICLFLSSLCHLLGCCQVHITKYVWRVDYAGICILIVCSFYPPVYYLFLCHPGYLTFYLTSTTILGCMAVAVTLLDRFQERSWRFFRAFMFVALGLYGLVPIIHQWFINNSVPQVQKALLVDLIMGATYISGAVIYAYRVPERWFPGKFDLWFHSHQIFHIAVVAGALIHYKACLLLLEWRDASGGCAVPVTDGPVSRVLQQMQDLGHDLHSIEEVWSKLQLYIQEHFASGATSAAAASSHM